jgi:SagB-type dehydrogenase family enzyme
VAWPTRRGFRIQNFLIAWSVDCGPSGMALLAGIAKAASASSLLDRLSRLGDDDPPRTLSALVRGGALVAERSPLARTELKWRRSWRWGPIAGAFHRSLRDLSFRTVEETQARLEEIAHRDPPPSVLPRRRPRTGLLPDVRTRHGVLPHLLRRESRRAYGEAPLRAQSIADVLFAGLGFRALLHDPVQGVLPLKLSPSGGARNAIEGHLLALRVEGVPPGIYRYAGLERDLVPVRRASRSWPSPSSLLGGQPWADGAAAIVFLVATFERAGWKYRHPLSYRMITLEAGHIAQNLLVTACDLGLAAWPSGALSDSAVETALGLRPPGEACLYAVVLGSPARPQSPSRSRSARRSRSGG